ncbi:PepSY domain-containing protein [Flavobacteriaceae bacterium F89]|uniref:PepSY domain-containing protein n=1 Tax=Cerina litoralis TaxID=2874477 RepID=A0AAE3JPX0_9FLAO|nr:PepSY domain-containing protein [Cerina litoralis]MCG2462555.1 PepSY domain-containing protein [Cerina litoralis]
MKKNDKLNKWLWKWHVISGLVSLPFVMILAITGGIYLFKDNYEANLQREVREVAVQRKTMSYQDQLQKARSQTDFPIDAMVLPNKKNEATKFISGSFGTKSTLYLNPGTGRATGEIPESTTDMFKVRKLHGELWMGGFGTKIVELVASWLIVLLITGLYIWWPSGKFKWKGFFIVRTGQGKRTFFRDLHAVTAIWFSGLLIMILLGGLPWTDVFGGSFKWVQQVTNTGFPDSWQGRGLTSTVNGKTLALDLMVKKAEQLKLSGEVSITLPKSETGVYSISNNPRNPIQMEIYQFDQYSGRKLVHNDWSDIGILMQGRLFFMAFHQGQFGAWNKWLMLFAAFMLLTLSIGAIFSYSLRKKKGWGIPKVPARFQIGKGILVMIVVLGVIFPLFGFSVLLILILELFGGKTRQRRIS